MTRATEFGSETWCPLEDEQVLIMEIRKVAAAGATAVVVGLLLAGCSTERVEPPTRTASPMESVGPSGTPEVQSDEGDAVEREILIAFEGFWAARVATQQGNLDSTLFNGYAAGPLVEEDMAVARNLAQYGFVREGEPGFEKTSVSVDGERAVVSSCVDYTSWVVPEAEGDEASINPIGVVVERIDGMWLVTDVSEAAAGLTC